MQWPNLGGIVVGLLLALIGLLVFGTQGKDSKASTPPGPAIPATKAVQVVGLYGCQYLVVDDGKVFAMVHHGGCSNRLHYVTTVNSTEQ
jgi:hypothetical protein